MRHNINLGFLTRTSWLCILAAVALFTTGCWMGSPGETSRQVHQRHVDVWKTNMLEIQDDVDAVLLFDKPSKLSDKAIR
ncbi:MAG: hypothetical protein KAR47_04490 [Planctomycetes bacterium]|nr:hypothetical protein [Planctomycetota bacterium]